MGRTEVIDAIESVTMPSDMAVVIVGSLARDEWAPSSDADLFILTRDDNRRFQSIVDATTTALKPLCTSHIYVGTPERFQRRAYEECHFGTSYVDAEALSGNVDQLAKFSDLRTQLFANDPWKTYFLRSLRYDCQAMKVRTGNAAAGKPIKYCVGGRMFLDEAMIACILTNTPPNADLLAAKTYLVDLLQTKTVLSSGDLDEFAVHAAVIVAVCEDLFNYTDPSPQWNLIQSLRSRVQIENAQACTAAADGIQCGAELLNLSEQTIRLAASYAFIFKLEDNNQLDQFDAKWPAVKTAIFAAPQLESIQAALTSAGF